MNFYIKNIPNLAQQSLHYCSRNYCIDCSRFHCSSFSRNHCTFCSCLAMHLLQSGINLVYIRDILGHVSIQTTDIYARADSKAKREALEKAYTNLNPSTTSTREWERNKNLREWLKGLN